MRITNPKAQERRLVCNAVIPPTRPAKVTNPVSVESKMHILTLLGRLGAGAANARVQMVIFPDVADMAPQDAGFQRPPARAAWDKARRIRKTWLAGERRRL